MKKLRWKIAQWFENQWWNNYLKGKSPKEYLAWKKSYWQNFLKEIELKKIQSPSIDIGCGPAGIFTIIDKDIDALDPLLAKYEGLDIFSKGKYEAVNFIESSFEDFKPKRKYKTVFCLNAINHFIDLKSSFRKLNSITEQNGTLIISIDAHNWSFFKWLFRLLPLDILHPHQYDLQEYRNFVTDNGYVIEKEINFKKEFFFDYYVIKAKKIK